MRYRIFTNDRNPICGVAMYSCFKEVRAPSKEEALRYCPPQFDCPFYAPAVAIRWPKECQCDSEKLWLKKHVGI